MEPTTDKRPLGECEELVEMRTHLTVAMLAAAQLRRATVAVPDAARFDGYLQQALADLRDDVRNVETLIVRTEAEPEPRCARATGGVCPLPPRRLPLPLRLPVSLARWVVSGVTQWVQRRRVFRLNLMTARY